MMHGYKNYYYGRRYRRRPVLVRTVAPTVFPISRDHVKLRNRIDTADHDTFIDQAIQSAIDYLDAPRGALNRALVQQTWQMKVHDFPASDKIELPFPPLRSVTSIQYQDADNVTQTLSTSIYQVVGIGSDRHSYIRLRDGEQWPEVYEDDDEAVVITFVCGYDGDGGSPEDFTANIPGPIKDAISLYVGHRYRYQDLTAPVTTVPLPFGFQMAIDPYIVKRL